MNLKSQIKRVPGLREVVHFARQVTWRSGDAHNQWARIVMNLETDRLIRQLDLEQLQRWKSAVKNGKVMGFIAIVP
jgi:hypothetical protein